MATPAENPQNSTLTYKIFRYQLERRRPIQIEKDVIDTKLNLTIGLIGELCNNAQHATWEDLLAFSRQAEYQKLLRKQSECAESKRADENADAGTKDVPERRDIQHGKRRKSHGNWKLLNERERTMKQNKNQRKHNDCYDREQTHNKRKRMDAYGRA